jgi:hypothetical protein
VEVLGLTRRGGGVFKSDAALLVGKKHDVAVGSLFMRVVSESLLLEVAQLTHVAEDISAEALSTIGVVKRLVNILDPTVVTFDLAESLCKSFWLHSAESRVVVSPVLL